MVFRSERSWNAKPNGNDLIIHLFGWIIIVGLATMEFVFYLMIGTGVSDFEELMDMLDYGILSAMLSGILSVLGPYCSGALHFKRLAWLFLTTDLARFKRDLDDRYSTFQKI